MALSRALFTMLVVVASAAELALAAAKGSDARAMYYCVAEADVPFWYSPFYGQSRGGATQCPDGTPWQGTLYLKNRAGSNLDTQPVSGNYPIYFQGNVVVCSGAYIHSFLWLNSNGNVTSDTSGENSQCAY